jgi:hypothetical protein
LCQGLQRDRKLGIMCKFGIVDYSVSGECGGGRGSEAKYRGRQRGR